MKRIIDRVIIIASIIIYVAFLVGLVYFGILVVRTIKRSKYIDIPRGVYRCEEYGIVITVYWDEETPKEYPFQDQFSISFDKNENARFTIKLDPAVRDNLCVLSEDFDFGGKVTLHEDGSFEWSIDYQRNAEEFGIKVGDKLRFIRISDYNGQKAQLKNEMIPYTEMLQNGDVSELEMTIYYINPAVLTQYPWGTDDLKSCDDVRVITISGEELSEQIDLLKDLSADNLQLINSGLLNARLCCEFSNDAGEVLLSFAFWGEFGNIYGESCGIYVNGIAVEENEVFYKLLIPYIPEENIKQYLTDVLTNIKG